MMMVRRCKLEDFEFWGPATLISTKLTEEEFQMLEDGLEELYPNGINETDLNDLFAYDGDYIVQMIGYDDEDDFYEKKNLEQKD